MASAVKLTNERAKVPMDIPDGRGNILHLEPKETKVVYGEPEYFRRMMRQGVTGLTVKTVTGKQAQEAEEQAVVDVEDDVQLVTITNHRKIPMELATGVDRVVVHIDPGRTSDPVMARVALIKQMTGISVRRVSSQAVEVHKPTAQAGSKSKRRARDDGPALKVDSEAGVPRTSEPPVESAAELRRRLGQPDTLAEFEQRLPRIVWHDLRGMAKQCGVKGKTRDEYALALKAKLYPKG